MGELPGQEERNNDDTENSAAQHDGRKEVSNLPVHFQECQAARLRWIGNLLMNAPRWRMKVAAKLASRAASAPGQTEG